MTKRKIKVGDVVYEKDGDPRKLGLVIHQLTSDPSLVVVKWPPDRQGYVYDHRDLVLAPEK